MGIRQTPDRRLLRVPDNVSQLERYMADREPSGLDRGLPSPTFGRRFSLSEVDSSSEDDFEERQNGDVQLALLSKSSRPTHKREPSGALGRKNETIASLVRGILKEVSHKALVQALPVHPILTRGRAYIIRHSCWDGGNRGAFGAHICESLSCCGYGILKRPRRGKL